MQRGLGTPGSTRRENDFALLRPDQFRDLRPRHLDHSIEL